MEEYRDKVGIDRVFLSCYGKSNDSMLDVVVDFE